MRLAAAIPGGLRRLGRLPGILRASIEIWATRRRLKGLENCYCEGSRPDEEVVPEYIATLSHLRDVDRQRQRLIRPSRTDSRGVHMHLGSGGHNLPDWINVDLSFDTGLTVCADVREGLPFRDGSADRIFSEDFLEHLEYEDAERVMRECRRVLRQTGAIRLGMPDLREIVKRVYLRRNRADLQWCRALFGDQTPCEALNRHMRMGGEHRFLYDWECLSALLRKCGFIPRRKSFHRTDFEEFRFLDLRGYGLSLYVEAVPRDGDR